MTEVRPATEKNCAVCGRNLLIGERSNPYIASGGEEVLVCELCKPRAEQAGWLRPEEAASARELGGRRRRRRRSGGELLGSLRARVERASDTIAGWSEEEEAEGEQPAADERAAAAPRRAPRERQRRRRSPEREADYPAQSVPAMRSTAGPDVVEALAAFNGSEHRRTVSGLSKSLGEPQATAIAVRTASGDTGARITVAWELTWYQWEVGPGTRGPEVREIARGETVEQLRAADRNWNLDVSRDGTLARRPIGGPDESVEEAEEPEGAEE